MKTKWLAAGLLAGSLLGASPAGATCDRCIGFRGPGFEITYCDFLGADERPVGRRYHEEYKQMARFLSFSMKVRGRVVSDPALVKRFHDAILHLGANGWDPFEPGGDPFQQDTLPQYVRHPDSLVKVFTSLRADTSAAMYTVVLGSYPSAARAEAAAAKWLALTQAWNESTLKELRLDGWSYGDCGLGSGWDADLFVLGPASRRQKGWRVLHGFFTSEREAGRGLKRVKELTGIDGKMSPITVDARVFGAAREWAEKVPGLKARQKGY